MSGDDDGFRAYRLLILEMLERHEKALADLKTSRYEDREISRERLLQHCKEMKAEILEELRPSSEVQAAQISGTWQMWATVVASSGAIIVALIALFT